jgi:hypothetical protein
MKSIVYMLIDIFYVSNLISYIILITSMVSRNTMDIKYLDAKYKLKLV